MQTYFFKVYFTDHPYDPSVCEAVSLKDAVKKAQEYIRVWKLDAVIDRIEQMTDEEIKEHLRKKQGGKK